jgi:NADH dehydrogenase
MATVGRSRAVAQTGTLKMRGFVAWVAWCLVHIMYLIGYRNRIAVLFEWAWSYVTFKRGARLITAHVGLEALPSAQAANRLKGEPRPATGAPP